MSENGEPGFQHTADVGAQRVARVYAEALLNAAERRGEVDDIAEELEALVRDVFRAQPQFAAFLASGAVGRDKKAAVLRSVFEHRSGELFLNFLVLNNNDRLDLLGPILDAYRDLRDQRARRMRVQVRSAAPLDDDQRERLRRELQETFHLEPILDAKVDPELLGGMLVRVGDWVYDASVRTQLETIRKEIIARSSHEIQNERNRFSN